MALLDDLERLLVGLRSLGRIVAIDELQPGLDATAIRSQLTAVDLEPDDDLLTYFAWRNGGAESAATIGELSIIPGFYPLSLEDAVINYRTFRDDPRWTAGWLPILADGGGDFYVVSLIGPDRGEVRHFHIQEAEAPVEFRSLSALFATYAEAFAQGLIEVAEGGFLLEGDEFDELAAQMNPGVAWWTEP